MKKRGIYTSCAENCVIKQWIKTRPRKYEKVINTCGNKVNNKKGMYVLNVYFIMCLFYISSEFKGLNRK